MSWAAWKCKQPQKVNKLGSGSSHKWQSEPFPANSRDFYLTIWKWHSKNCSLGAGKEVLHYRKQAWIWLKSENVLLGVWVFFVLLKGNWKSGDLQAVSEAEITPMAPFINWQMEYGADIYRGAALHWAVQSLCSLSFVLCQNRPKIHLLKCQTSVFWLCLCGNSFSISPTGIL